MVVLDFLIGLVQLGVLGILLLVALVVLLSMLYNVATFIQRMRAEGLSAAELARKMKDEYNTEQKD